MSMASLEDYKTPRPWLMLVIFLVVVVGVGLLIGSQSIPGEWYQALTKPPFNPPNWIFAPVWTVLYIMIAVAGWRIHMVDPKSAAMKIWYAQMVVNWLWSPTWFIGHQLWLALAIILVLLALIIAFIVKAARLDTTATCLFVPYLAWVAFATALNASIAFLN